MKKIKNDSDLLEVHKESLTVLGNFWEERFKSGILNCILLEYRTDVIRNYTIVDIIIKDDKKVLINWAKRHQPLTNEELKEKWGRFDV